MSNKLTIEQALAKTAEAVKVYSDEQRDAVRAETDEKVNRLKAKDVMIDKRLENIEQGLPADRWAVDDGVAYVKDVPENALPFASVDMVGGMTRKCTNLLDVDGIDFENEIKTGEIHGKEVDAVYKENTQYCFTCRTTNKTEGLSGHILYLRVYYTDGTDNGYSPIANFTDNNTFKQVVTEKGKTVQRIVFQYAVSATIAIDDAMLNEGTEPLPYEPYYDGLRSAPVTEVESVGVNLFDVSKITDTAQIKTGTGEIIQGIYTATSDFIAIKPNTTFVGNFINCCAFYDVSKKYISDIGDKSATIGRVLTMPQKAYYVRFSYRKDVANGNDVQLNKGTTALPYTPYRRNTLPIPAAVQALDGYGWGISDKVYNYIDFEKKQLVKWVEKVVFKGGNDEQWKLGSYGDFMYTNAKITNPIDAEKIYLISDRYEDVSFGDRINKSFPIAYVAPFDTTKNIAGLFFRNTGFTAVSEWQTHLAEQYASGKPVTVYYELAEPVITDISDLLPDDNLIGVEGGGTVTMVNEYGYDVPSEITYQLKGAEA